MTVSPLGWGAIALLASSFVACSGFEDEQASVPPSHPTTLGEIVKAYRHIVIGDEDRSTSILIMTGNATPDCSFIVTASRFSSLERFTHVNVDGEPVYVNANNTPLSQTCIASLIVGSTLMKATTAKVKEIDGTYCPASWIYRLDGDSITFVGQK